jgi:hypothetical protein
MVIIVRELPIIMDPVHIFLMKEINSQTNIWLTRSMREFWKYTVAIIFVKENKGSCEYAGKINETINTE